MEVLGFNIALRWMLSIFSSHCTQQQGTRRSGTANRTKCVCVVVRKIKSCLTSNSFLSTRSRISVLRSKLWDNIIKIKIKVFINAIQNKESLFCMPRVTSYLLLQCIRRYNSVANLLRCVVIVSDLCMCSVPGDAAVQSTDSHQNREALRTTSKTRDSYTRNL
jgi:hypothetical protein